MGRRDELGFRIGFEAWLLDEGGRPLAIAPAILEELARHGVQEGSNDSRICLAAGAPHITGSTFSRLEAFFAGALGRTRECVEGRQARLLLVEDASDPAAADHVAEALTLAALDVPAALAGRYLDAARLATAPLIAARGAVSSARWESARPVLEPDSDEHGRIPVDLRAITTSPSVIDMMADAAFHVGLVHYLVATGFGEDRPLDEVAAQESFEAVVREGLDAEIDWPDEGRVEARELLLTALVPAARFGLAALGIDGEDRDRFMDVIEARVATRITGRAFRRLAMEATGGDPVELTALYADRQASGDPAHAWAL